MVLKYIQKLKKLKSWKDFEIPLCHLPPLRSFLLYFVVVYTVYSVISVEIPISDITLTEI